MPHHHMVSGQLVDGQTATLRSPKRAHRSVEACSERTPCAIARSLVTAYPLRRQPRRSVQETNACPTTTWYRVSLWMVKLPRYARPNARRSFEACSTGPLGGYNRCELTCSQLRVELSERIVSITLIASTPEVVVAIENRTGKDATGRG